MDRAGVPAQHVHLDNRAFAVPATAAAARASRPVRFAVSRQENTAMSSRMATSARS
ncbi:hypothetical protein [Nonomuraea longispora]|uniref:hypothetical protein n=1 Tax=Nonomuraea longispora TaxID=1848320 RepID=UPI001404FFF3|nr:hypothetical protein [Nonomuraea longispora]